MKCETPKCKNDAPSLYQLGALFVCAPCVPDTAWKDYPKWKESKASALAKFIAHQGNAKSRKGKP